DLWSVGSEMHGDWGFGMMPGTSPSITPTANGGYEMAFESNGAALWSVGSEMDGDWGVGMMLGTRPSASSACHSGGASGSAEQTLTVSRLGKGSGTVRSVPSRIDCGSSCSGLFLAGSHVTLTASASAGSVFRGWSGGGCLGSGQCQVTMSAPQTVTA